LPDSSTPPIIIWVTFAIAVLGAIQPLAITMYRSYFRSRKVNLYESWFPDIGFGAFGPTAGIAGTIQSENALSVITRMELRITNCQAGDGAELLAFVNRVRKMESSAAGYVDRMEGSPWCPFQLSADTTVLFDINFLSQADRNAIELIVNKFLVAWLPYLTAKAQGQDLSDQGNATVFMLNTFKDASSEEFYVSAKEELLKQLFWKEGRYSLTVRIWVAGEKRTFSNTWFVTLTRDDIAALEANAERVLAYATGTGPEVVGPLYFANPAYEAQSARG
jgi:hypothetical protein